VVVTTISSREFNQDTSGAKRAAAGGPVFVTDRGKPSHVLLTIEEYIRLTGNAPNLLAAIAQAEPNEVDFAPPRLSLDLQIPDLGR
jgi:prevent-host-death family protein